MATEGVQSEELQIAEARQQLAHYRQEFVGIFRNPPRGIEIETVEVAWLPPEEQTQEILVDVPDRECSEVVKEYKVSYVRAKTGPIAQAVMIGDAGFEVTDFGGGRVHGWAETILPNGSLSGRSDERELSKLETTAIRCGEIFEVLKRRDEKAG